MMRIKVRYSRLSIRKIRNIKKKFALHNASIFMKKYPGISRSDALKMGWKSLYR